MIGKNRYLTMKGYHSPSFLGESIVASPALVIVKERATEKHLRDIINTRSQTADLTGGDPVIASKGASSFS